MLQGTHPSSDSEAIEPRSGIGQEQDLACHPSDRLMSSPVSLSLPPPRKVSRRKLPWLYSSSRRAVPAYNGEGVDEQAPWPESLENFQRFPVFSKP